VQFPDPSTDAEYEPGALTAQDEADLAARRDAIDDLGAELLNDTTVDTATITETVDEHRATHAGAAGETMAAAGDDRQPDVTPTSATPETGGTAGEDLIPSPAAPTDNQPAAPEVQP
jgi:hypothetical protein